VADELGVDAALADAARDQLRVLAAEVDDEDGPLLELRLRRRELDDLRALRAGNSALPS
jgi:hypothetical protein